jgi:nicotinic acid mononucleotide adenylyltransferase
MDNKEIIEKIHKSNFYGRFIEIGAGLPISTRLLSVAGASNTVDYTLSPYSKESCIKFFGDSKQRSVSREHIDYIAKKAGFIKDGYETFVLVTSFQLSRGNEDVISHGWIGIYFCDKNIYEEYHVDLSNIFNIETALGDLGIALLHNFLFPNDEPLPVYYANIVYSSGCINPYATLRHIESNGYYDNGVIFLPNGKITRIAEYVRGLDNILLYKGSFNPIHNDHINFITSPNLPDGTPIFMISLHTNYKDDNEIKDILKRVELINNLGYPVIVNRFGTFKDAIELLRSEHFIGDINFVMGSDTFYRLVNDVNEKFDNNRLTFQRCNIYTLQEYFTYQYSRNPEDKNYFYVCDTDFKGLVTHRGYHNLIYDLPNVFKIDVKQDNISSSDIRRKIRNNEPIGELVPKQILYKITEKYQNEQKII